jgi:predicted nucleic acid-binding protein
MAITIDTSAVIAIINGEPVKPRLLTLIGSEALTAPGSLPWEVGNAFSAMFKQGRASEADAVAALQILRQMPIDLVDVSLENAMGLAAKYRIYAYDAYILECAIRAGGLLLTLDGGLRHAAR